MSWEQRCKTQELQIGDDVAYSPQFLQGMTCGREVFAEARGKIRALIPAGRVILAEIIWDRSGLPNWGNVKNLCQVNQIGIER
jgi:hypothetical protein